jgi:hypothetical protein
MVGALALALALRDVDPAALAAAFARAGVLPIVLGAGVHVVVQALYALRWRVLLERPGALPTVRALGVVGLGYLANYTLPGRPGELVRGALARGLAGIPFALALASLFLEKVLDGVSILLSAFAFGALVGLPDWLRSSLLVGGAVFTLGGLLLLLAAVASHLRPLSLWERARVRAARSPLRLDSGSGHGAGTFIGDRLQEITAPTHAALRSPAHVVLYGALIWLAILTHIAVLCLGVGVAPQPAAWLLLYAVLGLASVVPGAPGYVGTYQLAAVLALGLFGVEREPAFAVATLYQLSRLIGALVVGSWAVSREGSDALRLARFGFLARRPRTSGR